MTSRYARLCLALALLGPLAAAAATYRCSAAGKTVVSDLPCAAGAERVDQRRDQVTAGQKQQAEAVDQKNRAQLGELEAKAARDRNYRGGINMLPAQPSPVTPVRPAPRPYYAR